MQKIIADMELSPEKELQYIHPGVVHNVACYDKQHRQLDVVWKEKPAEHPVAVADIHIHKRIKP